MTDDLEAEAAATWDIEQSMSLGLASASLAGILTAYVGPTFDNYVFSALICFSIVVPLMLTVYAIAHPASKSLNMVEYGGPVALATFIVSLVLTLAGYGLLLMHLSWGLGVFFMVWCPAALMLVLGGCAVYGNVTGTAVLPSPRTTPRS
ncbi:hypothetical protein MesoLj113a_50310 [Mesorhizobium sp. 113-1-2]|uniref:hypothetical protein n=1 Tax=Mesorhizobium sp. 113-1-2 TaxID=2744515 RepID=UPI0019286F9E|nr:hypothetical protein [Mesorhizobium sp. 113-1-2]BCG73873.1 hypothetical protein MesoLj113a_50310 [Mesorhizobium sp. 113-1-2]